MALVWCVPLLVWVRTDVPNTSLRVSVFVTLNTSPARPGQSRPGVYLQAASTVRPTGPLTGLAPQAAAVAPCELNTGSSDGSQQHRGTRPTLKCGHQPGPSNHQLVTRGHFVAGSGGGMWTLLSIWLRGGCLINIHARNPQDISLGTAGFQLKKLVTTFP